MRAHKIRLVPNPEQEEYFRKACGTARFVYNWGLGQIKVALEAGEKPEGVWALKKRLNSIKREEFPWILEVTKCAPEGAFVNLGNGLKNFFDSRSGKRKGHKVSFPAFKKKGRSKDAFVVNNDKFRVEGRSVRLPHIGWVKMAEELRFNGKIMSATISRTANHWYVSLSVEIEEKSTTHKSHVKVGIDLGVKTAVVMSTGKTFESPKALHKNLKRLRRLNRKLHRRQLGSANRRKVAEEIARLYERITNIRRDWQHKVTTCIARRHSFIVVEDLNVAGMNKLRSLARAVADVGMSEVPQMLRYKVPHHGGQLVKISRWFPSSKACRKCGNVKDDLTLADRVYRCAECGHAEDRDLHASRNVLREGMRLSS